MIKESGGDADLEEMAKQELKDAKAEKEEYEEKLKILLFQRIQTMIRTSSLKSVEQLVEMKQHFRWRPSNYVPKVCGSPRLAL